MTLTGTAVHEPAKKHHRKFNGPFQELWAAFFVWLAIFGFSFFLYAPFRSYFYGDSWDLLYGFLTNWRVIFQPHNEHFIPLFKGFYFLEYKLFGAHHLWFMVVSFALHASNATLVYLIGKRLSLGVLPSAATAALFAINSVYWEVISWDFEQVFLLGTLFALAVIYVIYGRFTTTKPWVISVLSLLVYFSAGLIGLSLTISLSFYYFWTCAAKDLKIAPRRIFQTLYAIWIPFVIYLLAFRAVASFSSVLAINHTRLGVHSIKPVVDTALYGWLHGLILPALTFNYPQLLGFSVLLLTLIILFIVRSYSGLSLEKRSAFWMFFSLSFAPVLVIAFGRSQFGVAAGVSSRYEYLPMAPLALLIILSWQGYRSTFIKTNAQRNFNAVGMLLLAAILAYHVQTIRKNNPGAIRGEQAQQFLESAKQAIFSGKNNAGVPVFVPNLSVPEFVYAPGRIPLWKVLEVLERGTIKVASVEDIMGSNDSAFTGNLIKNGGFEDGTAHWETYAGAQLFSSHPPAYSGNFGGSIILPQPGSAVSQDVLTTCPRTSNNAIFTFAIHAKTDVPNSLIARIIFKNSEGNILQVSASDFHPGDGQWHQLFISGLAPNATCIVGIDLSDANSPGFESFITDANSPGIESFIDDAILLSNPKTVDIKRKN